MWFGLIICIIYFYIFVHFLGFFFYALKLSQMYFFTLINYVLYSYMIFDVDNTFYFKYVYLKNVLKNLFFSYFNSFSLINVKFMSNFSFK